MADGTPLSAEMSERLASVTLDDKYALEDGVAFMTGTQALIRLTLEQSRRDRAAGLRTGGYVSGYRGIAAGRCRPDGAPRKDLSRVSRGEVSGRPE